MKVGDMVLVLDDWGANSVKGEVIEVCEPPWSSAVLLFRVAFGGVGRRLSFAGQMKLLVRS